MHVLKNDIDPSESIFNLVLIKKKKCSVHFKLEYLVVNI